MDKQCVTQNAKPPKVTNNHSKITGCNQRTVGLQPFTKTPAQYRNNSTPIQTKTKPLNHLEVHVRGRRTDDPRHSLHGERPPVAAQTQLQDRYERDGHLHCRAVAPKNEPLHAPVS